MATNDPNSALILALKAQLEQQQQLVNQLLLQKHSSSEMPQTAPFDVKQPDLWEDWVRVFKRSQYCKSAVDDSDRIDRLLVAMGVHGEAEFRKLRLSHEARENFDNVVDALTVHFVGRKTLVYRRYLFHNRYQKPGESARQYVAEVRQLADKCAFDNMIDPVAELVCSQIVCGIADQQLRESLLADPKICLDRVISKMEAREQSHIENLSIASSSKVLSPMLSATGPASVDRVIGSNQRSNDRNRSSGRFEKRNTNSNRYSSPSSSSNANLKCFNCGAQNFTMEHRSKCPAHSTKCSVCGIVGHYATCCKKNRNNSKNKVNVVSNQTASPPSNDDNTSPDGDNVFYIYNVNNSSPLRNSPSANLFSGRIRFNGRIIRAKFDSGVEVSIIPPQLVPVGSKILPTKRKLRGAADNPLTVVGCVRIPLANPRRTINEDFYIIEQQRQLLIGAPALSKLGILTMDRWSHIQSVEDSSSFEEAIVARYPKLFHDHLGTIPHTYLIETEKNAIPYAVATARNVSIPLKDGVVRELRRMEALQVIEKVDQPTLWCAPMVVAKKKNGELRICTDFSKLNQFVRRPRIILPNVETSLAEVGRARIFSKLDAASGFWQVPLHKACRNLTTFITPIGHYRYRRLPFGITSAPEFFQAAMSKLLEGLEGVICHMDDVLIFGSTQQQHNGRMFAILDRMAESGLVLNRRKCIMNKSEVKFLGQIVSREYVRPDPERIRAISKFPRPTTVKGVRSLLGSINQLSKFVPRLAEMSEPIRALLRKNATVHWDQAQQSAFDDIVQAIKAASDLIRYDVTARTAVISDASNKGLGAVLMQTDAHHQWKPVSFASRTLISSETNYASIEKEALAATWAIEKFRCFLDGKRFELYTDHLPLVSLFGKKDLNQVPTRIQRFRMRLLPFVFDVKHVPGREMHTADFLSRYPLPHNKEDVEGACDVEEFVQVVIDQAPISAVRLKQIAEVQKSDPECVMLRQLISNGWPKYASKIPPLARKWTAYRNELSIIEDVLFWRQRVIIPFSIKGSILEIIHDGHLGIVRCQARARESVFWPSVVDDVAKMVQNCAVCAVHRRARPAPLLQHEYSEEPWMKVGVDLFFIQNTTYLVVADYFSGFFELAVLSPMSTERIVKAMKTMFARWGIPKTVMSDSGAQFTGAEWTKFANEYGFTSVTSSPHHHQSNGLAERCVQTAKNLVHKNSDLQLALLTYRATPNSSGFSPAELMVGRRIRTRLPTHPRAMAASDYSQYASWKEQQRKVAKDHYDAKHRVTSPQEFNDGERVFVTDLREYATIEGPASEPRSWFLRSTAGRRIRRNQINITKIPKTPSSVHTKPFTTPTKGDSSTVEDQGHKQVETLLPLLEWPEAQENVASLPSSPCHTSPSNSNQGIYTTPERGPSRNLSAGQQASFAHHKIDLSPVSPQKARQAVTLIPPIISPDVVIDKPNPVEPNAAVSTPIKLSMPTPTIQRSRPIRNIKPPKRYLVDAVISS